MSTYASVTLKTTLAPARNMGVRVSPAARIADVPISARVAAPLLAPITARKGAPIATTSSPAPRKRSKGAAKTTQPHGEFGVSVGDWGRAVSLLRPAGKARFGDRYVDVVTDGSFVNQGKQVRVVEISGNRVVVREVEET